MNLCACVCVAAARGEAPLERGVACDQRGPALHPDRDVQREPARLGGLPLPQRLHAARNVSRSI